MFISMFHLTQHILSDRNSIKLDLELLNFGTNYQKKLDHKHCSSLYLISAIDMTVSVTLDF